MPRRSDDRIDELLAEGRLGGPARERVLGRVLGSLTPVTETPSGRRPLRFMLAAFVAAGAVGAVIMLRPGDDAADGMRAKGGQPPSAAVVTPLCATPDGVCHAGDRLLFRVEAAREPAFMLAYAEPVQSAAPGVNGRVWIFPTASGESPEVVPAAEPYVLPRAVEIDSTFSPGRYRLTIVLARRALTRAEALAATDAVRTTSTLVIGP